MRFLLALILAAAPLLGQYVPVPFTNTGGGGGSTFVQALPTQTTGCSGTTTCTNTFLTPVGAGHGIVIFVTGLTAANISSIKALAGGETFSVQSGCQETAHSPYVYGCGYVLSATGGETVITAVLSTPANHIAISGFELNWGGGTPTYDTSGSTDHFVNATSHVGPTLSLGGTDTIIQLVNSGAAAPNVTAVSSPYGNSTFWIVDTAEYATGIALSLDTVSGTGPTWTTANGPAEMGAIAFKVR